LESNGILDALTKVLVGLYEEPEKPMDPLEYPSDVIQGCENVFIFVFIRLGDFFAVYFNFTMVMP